MLKGEQKKIRIPDEALELLIKEIQMQAKERDQNIKPELYERLKQDHVCIRIFEDDAVIITYANGLPIEGVPQKDLPGPLNTYPQALWYNHSPT
jgi:hypothetical protein